MRSGSLESPKPPPTLSVVPGSGRSPDPSSGSDRATQLGLYLGYDRARVALGRLASQLGREALDTNDAALAEELGRTELERGARAAAFAAFTLVSDQAEAIRRDLCERWPELREDHGGPVPVRAGDSRPSTARETQITCKKNRSTMEPRLGGR